MREVGGERVGDGLLQVVVHDATCVWGECLDKRALIEKNSRQLRTLFYAMDYVGKVVVQQDEIGSVT